MKIVGYKFIDAYRYQFHKNMCLLFDIVLINRYFFLKGNNG